MSRLVLGTALLSLVFASAASASPVKPPAGWTTDPKQAVSLSEQLGALPHFGGLRSIVTTEVFHAPAGGALYATRIVSNIANLDPKVRDRAATAELDELRATMMRAGATAKFDAGKAHAIADAKILEATGRWHDESTGVVVTSRMVIAADAQQLVAVSGECVLAGDAAKDVETACNGALASLDPDLAPAARIELTISSDVVKAKPPTMQPPAEGSSSPGLLDGNRPAMAPIQIPQPERETDRRPVYVGLGLIVLAAVFWFNRRRREQLEREHEAGAAKPRDRDDDDLHAAAEDTDAEKSATKESKDS